MPEHDPADLSVLLWEELVALFEADPTNPDVRAEWAARVYDVPPRLVRG